MTTTIKESSDPVIASNHKFSHVMALALDSTQDFQSGLLRCILSRHGDVVAKGQIDRSELRYIQKRADGSFEIGDVCQMRRQDEILSRITDPDFEFIGLEDPDIFFHEKTGLLHVYFSISFVEKDGIHTRSYLGHAFGPSLHELEMTIPVLWQDQPYACAKELSIVPPSRTGVRNNLVESHFIDEEGRYNSTVRVATCSDPGSGWQFGEALLIPFEQNDDWISGHVSPGPFMPREFLDVGEGKLVGFLNGRSPEDEQNGQTLYGMFAVGLFIYDYEKAKIDWVSSEPIIIDSLARTITFASQFVVDSAHQGTLYAHVDDSFVRAYKIDAREILERLPTEVACQK
jgi:hypothetical protein